jgi:hypothetical protein
VKIKRKIKLQKKEPEAPSKGKKVRSFKSKKISKDETIHAGGRVRHGESRPGRWILNHLAKSNPNVAKMRDALRGLAREDLEDRLSIIYCELLGLAGMESQ